MLNFILNSSFLAVASGKELTVQCRRHKTQVQFLGWEDTLEECTVAHFSILA